MYGVVLSEETGMDAAGFAKALADRGIETRPFFLGMHEQPVFMKKGLFKKDRYPVAERIARRGLYLPSGLALTNDQIECSAQALKESLARGRGPKGRPGLLSTSDVGTRGPAPERDDRFRTQCERELQRGRG